MTLRSFAPENKECNYLRRLGLGGSLELDIYVKYLARLGVIETPHIHRSLFRRSLIFAKIYGHALLYPQVDWMGRKKSCLVRHNEANSAAAYFASTAIENLPRTITHRTLGRNDATGVDATEPRISLLNYILSSSTGLSAQRASNGPLDALVLTLIET
ncbi:uncharacterized protein FOMMEDRAFT_150435 [Fomitiporia mediterranea MF3/22]|uniref:uncharacterized protein n=1 Tax=Fomitiporia mediterranea (strain MF3/22) TaxID=694068 RepID=UPI00044095CC|nr:uncharacterized protein FOMMEDRAFT_150435 [Fomitiporia mediterranea MF3/22]EJD07852.1 hypothetical protein FOMMEDRAFT_150435 [Fomitiporia mediterranea MF3/22]